MVSRKAGPPARARWHSWHLALRKSVSQAGLWSIISLSNLALVQPGRTTSCIPRNPSQLTENGTVNSKRLYTGAWKAQHISSWDSKVMSAILAPVQQSQESMEIGLPTRRVMDHPSHRFPLRFIHLPKLPVLKYTRQERASTPSFLSGRKDSWGARSHLGWWPLWQNRCVCTGCRGSTELVLKWETEKQLQKPEITFVRGLRTEQGSKCRW